MEPVPSHIYLFIYLIIQQKVVLKSVRGPIQCSQSPIGNVQIQEEKSRKQQSSVESPRNTAEQERHFHWVRSGRLSCTRGCQRGKPRDGTERIFRMIELDPPEAQTQHLERAG